MLTVMLTIVTCKASTFGVRTRRLRQKPSRETHWRSKSLSDYFVLVSVSGTCLLVGVPPIADDSGKK